MDYITDSFTASRLVPKRRLRLPLEIRYQSLEVLTAPHIYEGAIYQVKPKVSVNAYSRSNLSLEFSNNEEMFVVGGFGYGDGSFFVGTKAEKVCCLSLPELNKLYDIEFNLVGSDLTARIDGDYLVMFRDDWSRSSPIKVGRFNSKARKIEWEFTPERVIKGFSISEDGEKVVVNDHAGGIAALDVETGKVLWQKNLQNIGVLTEKELIEDRNQGPSSVADIPHLVGDVIVMRYVWSHTIGLDIDTGDLVWKNKTRMGSSRATVDYQGWQYILTSYEGPQTLIIIDGKTGDILKEEEIIFPPELNKIITCVYSDVTDTHFWGACGSGLLYAINLETNEVDWHYEFGGGLTGNPFFICNNRLFLTTHTDQFIFEGVGGYIQE